MNGKDKRSENMKKTTKENTKKYKFIQGQYMTLLKIWKKKQKLEELQKRK